MPKCGSQCWLCDYPVRFDTYKGCSHGCKYCFAQRKVDLNKIEADESVVALRNFVEGKRNKSCSWVDWKIPLHWGGLSDPFQPCEKTRGRSLECLQYLAETGYPFIVSTKGALIADEEYLALLERCNVVLQVSAVCPSYDVLEPGCPTWNERLEIIRKVSPRVQRVIVRIQPYMHEVFHEVAQCLPLLAEAGVYGVIIEGMKFTKKKPGLVRVGTDYTYPYSTIKSDFLELKEIAHAHGLKIYSGENRTRSLGDSLSCCGADGLGFMPNTYNLNHLLNGDKVSPTQRMQEPGTADVFKELEQETLKKKKFDGLSYVQGMSLVYKEKERFIKDVFGIGMK